MKATRIPIGADAGRTLASDVREGTATGLDWGEWEAESLEALAMERAYTDGSRAGMAGEYEHQNWASHDRNRFYDLGHDDASARIERGEVLT